MIVISVDGLIDMINPDPIKVLMVYYEPFPSGQTTHVLSLAKGLNRDLFKVQVFLPESLKSVAGKFRAAGAEVILAPFCKTYWGIVAILRLFKLIKDNPATIVHFHSQEAALIGRPLAKLAGASHILYTPQTIDIRQKQYQKVYTAIEVLSARITDKVFSVNESDRLRLISWGIPRDKTVTIYNGIDLDAFKTAPDRLESRKILGVSSDRPLVMQIGRMSVQKSPLDFVEGAAIVLKTHPEVQFVMIGDGPLLSDVKQRVCDLGLTGNITVTGAIENAYFFIPAADILTLTSAWEGTPYTVLEAMAFAKPVVATSVNGCPEIIDHGQSGLLVPTGDTRMWANCVIELIDYPRNAYQFGQNGRRRLEEYFTLPTMIQKIENLYTQSVARSKF